MKKIMLVLFLLLIVMSGCKFKYHYTLEVYENRDVNVRIHQETTFGEEYFAEGQSIEESWAYSWIESSRENFKAQSVSYENIGFKTYLIDEGLTIGIFAENTYENIETLNKSQAGLQMDDVPLDFLFNMNEDSINFKIVFTGENDNDEEDELSRELDAMADYQIVLVIPPSATKIDNNASYISSDKTELTWIIDAGGTSEMYAYVEYEVQEGSYLDRLDEKRKFIAESISEAWSKFRGIVSGEDFKVIVPTATCGVRG